MKKKHNWFAILFLIVYTFFVGLISFFPKTQTNEYLSTRLFIAHFYAFPFLFGSIICILFLIKLFKSVRNNDIELTVVRSLVILVSLVFMLCPYNKKLTKVDSSKKTDIKIVAWNTAGFPDEYGINKIFKNFNADVVILSECEQEKLEKAMGKSTIDLNKYQIFTSKKVYGNKRIQPVTIAIKKEFGLYTVEEQKATTAFGTLYLKAADGKNPDIIGLHPAPPILGSLFYAWRDDLKNIVNEIIKNNPNAIIAGDFNATMRHGQMNSIKSHKDVLDYKSRFKRGTWHVTLGSIFKTSIDHILLPNNQYGAKSVEILNLRGSDHMAIFTEIAKTQ